MIAVDTNILVYAHREESNWYEPALKCVAGLAESTDPWAVPWPCFHEFFAIVTNARVFGTPSTVRQALDQIAAWMESPALVVLSESEGYWETLRSLVETSRVTGAQIHDARVAALCLVNGVGELWTADRDFDRFRDLKTTNPLTAT